MPISVSKDAVGSFGSVEPGKSFFLDDVFESDDKAKPISGGIFIYNKSPEDFECGATPLLSRLIKVLTTCSHRHVQM